MQFTILSHAGLLVESRGTSLMCDPWILGSCYWRSWWNYPKPAPFAARMERLDYVYLTHMHWDHFHGPSLRRLPRDATLLIPQAHFRRFRKDAEIFKFKEIVELPHGKKVRLADGLTVTSYQYGLSTDSALAIEDGETTLLDLNDCKITGRPLKQVLRRHPKVDFVFRSHSSASPFPHCMHSEDPEALAYRTNEDYVREFVETARIVKARYAIPFASDHCFLHRDTYRYNDTAVSPQDVKSYFDEHKPAGSECVVMVAGDSWSEEKGFQLQEHDWYTNRPARIAEYAREKAPVLEEYYALEERAEIGFRPFRRYFQKMVDAIPRVSRRVFRPVVVFELPGRDDVHWVVDFDRREVTEAEARPEDWKIAVTIPPLVLKDCVYKRMFAVFWASKRVSVEVRSGAMRDFLVFMQLLDMWEYEFFPLRQLFTARSLEVWLRRWREVLDYAQILAGIAITRGRGGDPLRRFVPKIEAS